MEKIKIVLVDDHTMFLSGLEAILRKQTNLNIVFVTNKAEDALVFLSNETPHLIITDISMPGMNGIEFIKVIKEDFPEVKILVISMFKEQFVIEGIDGYLLKESPPKQLLEAISSIVENGTPYFYDTYLRKEETLDFENTIVTSREKEIISLVAKEYTTDEIAERLFLSKYTIESHKKNIFLKLKVNNVAGLLAKGRYLGYLD